MTALQWIMLGVFGWAGLVLILVALFGQGDDDDGPGMGLW